MCARVRQWGQILDILQEAGLGTAFALRLCEQLLLRDSPEPAKASAQWVEDKKVRKNTTGALVFQRVRRPGSTSRTPTSCLQWPCHSCWHALCWHSWRPESRCNDYSCCHSMATKLAFLSHFVAEHKLPSTSTLGNIRSRCLQNTLQLPFLGNGAFSLL